jgi:hypothetical protein
MTREGTMTLTDFLLARIAEDEAVAQRVVDSPDRNRYCDRVSFREYGDEASLVYHGAIVGSTPARVLAECEAKRRIVELHSDDTGHECPSPPHGITEFYGGEPDEDAPDGDWCPTLRALAQPYADHSDFRDEWKLIAA